MKREKAMVMEPTKREKRVREILSLLVSHPHLTVPELAKMVGYSESTLRNDLQEMERKGMVKRVYGGVIASGTTALNAGVAARYPAFQKEKQSIAQYVLEHYITPGLTLFLDAGTTGVELAKAITTVPFQVNVLTNSLEGARIITSVDHHVLHLAGGRYDSMSGSFHDHNTDSYLGSVHADIFFLCPAAISVEIGLGSPDHNEVALKKIMMRNAQRVIALADHSKLNKTSFYPICRPDEVEACVTDAAAAPDDVQKIRNAGCNLVLADLVE